MLRFRLSALLFVLGLALPLPAFCAEGTGLSTETGNLLRGALYKQSGIEREGVITITTSWKMPGIAPVYRYDFDILYGTIDKNLYSYLLADIAEIEFLPVEDGAQPVNLKLRNGVMQKVVLTSGDKTLIGTVKLRFKQAFVVTDTYGENIVEGGDVSRIVFSPPPAPDEEDMAALVDRLGKALQVGKRDDLVDDDFLKVLDTLHKKMKARARPE